MSNTIKSVSKGYEMRKLKDGWKIYQEWVEKIGNGKREHWVLTDCRSCSCRVPMPLKLLAANGPDECDGCEAYQDHFR